MKKVILLVLSIIMLVSLVAPVSAEEQATTISEEEAGALINKAVDLFDAIHLDAPKGVLDKENFIELTYTLFYYETGEEKTKKDPYYLVADESKLPGGSFEALSEYARSVYTEDIADSMYNTSCFSYHELEQPMFYQSESGQLYMLYDVGRDWCQVRPYRYGYKYLSNQVTTDVVDIVYADSDKATVRYLTSIGPDGPRRLVWVDCYLVNTENGWRIAESPFTQMLRYERHAWSLWEPTVTPYEESPSTGDVSGERVAVIGAVSLACIIPTACLMRRRRRSSAE